MFEKVWPNRSNMFGKFKSNKRNLFDLNWPNRDLAASLTFFYFPKQEHPSIHCSNIDIELTIDYSTDFTVHKIFQIREGLINWAQEVHKS